ncbi:hypothetical protein D3C72_808400 [compost metagenome]
MNELSVKIGNCYGIGRLEYKFEFNPHRAYSIYAPNGFMKTSFARTLADFSVGRQSSDLMFPSRDSTREVLDESGNVIPASSVLVIDSYNQSYQSDKTSLLLVNSTLKSQYESAIKSIDLAAKELFSELKQSSGLTGRTNTPESELVKIFANAGTAYDVLVQQEGCLEDPSLLEIKHIEYAQLFNEKVLSVLESGQISVQLQEYMTKYNELIEKSPVLSQSFNHYHANTIHKSLSDNGFFTAGHSINLSNGETKDEITTPELFLERLEKERRRILAEADLEKRFDAIDKKLSNAELRKFREYLFEHKEIVARLANFRQLRVDLWRAYLLKHRDSYNAFLKEFTNGKAVIEQVYEAARNERTDWEQVVEVFNSRFSVPFRVAVANQEDVILKGVAPNVSFSFFDREASTEVDKAGLLKVLSQGEKKALYLLNVLFEIHCRSKSETPTVVIVDDIADSFDYKNKYAIIEYFKEVVETHGFPCIFLTHNFDFHRAVSSRIGIHRNRRLFASKDEDSLVLLVEKYQNNPFTTWRRNLHVQLNVLASIPFVRNIAEYCGWDAEFSELTSMLHFQPDAVPMTIRDLERIFRVLFKDQGQLVLENQDLQVIDLIVDRSNEISSSPAENYDLEHKVVLAMGIRLQAEKYIISRINDAEFVRKITKNQTAVLVGEFKNRFPTETDTAMILSRVNLMTPENIHLNSFMYEPILDMGVDQLKQLCLDVAQLCETAC